MITIRGKSDEPWLRKSLLLIILKIKFISNYFIKITIRRDLFEYRFAGVNFINIFFEYFSYKSLFKAKL